MTPDNFPLPRTKHQGVRLFDPRSYEEMKQRRRIVQVLKSVHSGYNLEKYSRASPAIRLISAADWWPAGGAAGGGSLKITMASKGAVAALLGWSRA